MRSDIFVLADLILHLRVKAKLLFDNARDADFRCRVLSIWPLRERPSTEDVMYESEIILSVMLGIDNCAAHLLKRQFLALCLLSPLFILPRLAEFFIDSAQNPIDKSSGGVAAEGLGKLNGLIHGDLRRHLYTV